MPLSRTGEDARLYINNLRTKLFRSLLFAPLRAGSFGLILFPNIANGVS